MCPTGVLVSGGGVSSPRIGRAIAPETCTTIRTLRLALATGGTSGIRTPLLEGRLVGAFLNPYQRVD
jgi:hypothetical protein